MKGTFIDERRLMNGPWQAFERDIARLLISASFKDVRVVGGSGDHGADVLAMKNGQLWVVQCKHTTSSPAPRTAVTEVVNAGEFYECDRLFVATSRPAGTSLKNEINRHARIGKKVELLEPRKILRLAAKLPEYPPTRRLLREYQQEASERFREALIDTGRAQIVLATGLGKTIVMAETVADMLSDGLVPYDRVLVLADKRELVDQLQAGFWYQLPKFVPTHRLASGEEPTFWDGITFATVQSVLNRIDDLPKFGLVLVDEAHHIGSVTFRKTIHALAPEMVGGVTATPWRGDNYDIDEILGPALTRIGISEGLKHGFLCDVDYRLLADDLDWKFVQDRSLHSYSLSALNRKLIIPTRDEEVAKIIKTVFDEENRRAGLAFCPSILHAKSLAGTLRSFGLRAEAISGEMDSRRRDKLMYAFRRGEIDLMTSVDLFNEGVDVPDVDLIAFLRATHSRRIFVQQLGRGLRISDGKDKVIALDFVSDLRRIAEVIELEKAASSDESEKLPLGNHLIQFNDYSAGSFLQEWMKDQADLFLREGDPKLELPQFDYPKPAAPGGVN